MFFAAASVALHAVTSCQMRQRYVLTYAVGVFVICALGENII